ncbi:hypothetical protein BC629DRAFT_1438105 [Irpex lacteus]|nr:hypothetical protein BC629DRAFT_1438105 [Irpex lacteus]
MYSQAAYEYGVGNASFLRRRVSIGASYGEGGWASSEPTSAATATFGNDPGLGNGFDAVTGESRPHEKRILRSFNYGIRDGAPGGKRMGPTHRMRWKRPKVENDHQSQKDVQLQLSLDMTVDCSWKLVISSQLYSDISISHLRIRRTDPPATEGQKGICEYKRIVRVVKMSHFKIICKRKAERPTYPTMERNWRSYENGQQVAECNDL